MKKITLFWFFALLSFINNAQINDSYNFSVTNENYTNLINSTSLNNGTFWDDPDFTIPIGFDFEIAGKTISTIYIAEDISSGGIVSDEQFYDTDFSAFAPSLNDLVDKGDEIENTSLSNISYSLEGTVGNRIFKLEWKNAGFWEDSTGEDFINMQLWLYEGTHIIEFRYGPYSVNNPSESYEGLSGPIVGLIPSYNGINDVLTSEGYLLSGSPTSPTLNTFPAGTSFEDPIFLDGDIPNGSVYRFTPGNLSNDKFQLDTISIYPNPAEKDIYFKSSTAISSLSIYNSLGTLIAEKNNIKNIRIDVSNFADGIYYAKITAENGTSSIKKFIKK